VNWTLQEMPLDGPLFDGAIKTYGDAFISPPYRDPGRGHDVRDRLRSTHRHRSGYRGLIAVEDGLVVGMVYGYRSREGQWWHDAVAEELDPSLASDWLKNSFELAEVAVAPRRQNRGIGGALVNELLKNRSEETCVLSTRTDSDAHRLYDRLGFEAILSMRFATAGALFFIMGKRLIQRERP